ncbi:Glutamyl-tRNA amidotransferase subunit A, mitochondrial [Ephemerocybe angulata]|uniref:Glutamyl-tRNA(Gln) amidotransferase subunit A, mitochondrial n=1 Tax=Ephemerocybe angulata TaxID=980116 RepID=A0A8H6IA85_9AGAR|nr:Glutamyl-tRNA amidotransferase subunit A, mitochondrial [Tulosesus angulatus]
MRAHARSALTRFSLPSSRCTRCYSTRQALIEQNAKINAFVHISPESAASASKAGALQGLKVAVKDNIATKDSPTTCSSAILKDFVSPFDATVVKQLRRDGADIVGKTNCDEFGMGSLNVYSVHGPTLNPFPYTSGASTGAGGVEERSAGGSSGGSAAAVAMGLCDAALGTDTGGSIRLPASYCGVVGFKPSYGLVSRWGVVSYADSLDCVGVLGADVPVVSRVFDRISAFDTKDPTSAEPELREAASTHARRRLESLALDSGRGKLDGLRIGIPQEFFPSELSPAVLDLFRGVLQSLQARGATLVPVSLPSSSYALSAYYVLASAEASSNMARYDGIQYGKRIPTNSLADLRNVASVYAQGRSAGFGPEVQRRILLGTYALTSDAFDNYFLQAQRVRQLVKDDFDAVFSIPNVRTALEESVEGSEGDSGKVDVLLHPSAIGSAPPLSPDSSKSPLDSYVQDLLTVPASLAGVPALSVPCPTTSTLLTREAGEQGYDGWPVGVSVIGQWGSDELVLAVGQAVAEGRRT